MNSCPLACLCISVLLVWSINWIVTSENRMFICEALHARSGMFPEPRRCTDLLVSVVSACFVLPLSDNNCREAFFFLSRCMVPVTVTF